MIEIRNFGLNCFKRRFVFFIIYFFNYCITVTGKLSVITSCSVINTSVCDNADLISDFYIMIA